MTADIRAIFNAPNDAAAKRFLELFVKKYAVQAPKLSEWAETNIPEGLAVMQFPFEHQLRIRTSNMLEMVIKEVKRRIKVVGLFLNEYS